MYKGLAPLVGAGMRGECAIRPARSERQLEILTRTPDSTDQFDALPAAFTFVRDGIYTVPKDLQASSIWMLLGWLMAGKALSRTNTSLPESEKITINLGFMAGRAGLAVLAGPVFRRFPFKQISPNGVPP